MENLNSYRLVNKEEIDEINRLSLNAEKILLVQKSDSYENKLDKLNKFINDIKQLNNGELEERAYELGSFFGNLIVETYGWNWYQIKVNDDDFYCVASNKQRACCICHNYVYSILSKRHRNNLKLLFNMIKKEYPKNWHFMILT